MKKLSALALVASALFAGQASAYTVDVYQQSPYTGISNLAQADALIAGTLTATGQYSIIDFDDLQDGTRGNFSVNNPWPGNLNTGFAAHVYGSFFVATAGTYIVGTNHDDGDRLRIDGAVVSTSDVITDNINSTASVFLTAGVHTMDIVFFENAGGASLEFAYYNASGQATQLITSVPEPATLSLVGLALLGLGWRARKQA